MGNSIFSLSGAGLYGGEIDKQRAVWERAAEIPGLDRATWRYDAVGKVICYSDYGDRSSTYGWEIDHYPIPTALGGTDDIFNLRALNCFSNASHGGLLGAFINRGGIR